MDASPKQTLDQLKTIPEDITPLVVYDAMYSPQFFNIVLP